MMWARSGGWRTALCAAVTLALPGCGLFGESGPLRVVTIGTIKADASPANGELSGANAALVASTAQGLVSFDSDGQIDVGLAERWTVTADGLSYIFRIREARWADNRKVTAEQVAAALRAAINPAGRNALRRDFPEVQTIRAMTDTVIEVRLVTPQPNLLELLAQPAMAIQHRGRGWGPMRLHRNGRELLLTPMPDPLAEDPEAAAEAAADPENSVELVGTSGDRAVARFQNGYADAIIGGRFSTLPYFVAGKIPRSRLVVDPAPGLFGLVVTRADGLLATDTVRDALSRTLRRDRMIEAFGLQEWRSVVTIQPSGTPRGSAPAPITPAWADFDDASRQTQARRVVPASAASSELRIALPSGPGARILFAYIAADLKAIGITARRVNMASAADLRLIDEVMPYDDPIWALRRINCAPGTLCNRDADNLLRRAVTTRDATERARLIGETEAILMRYSGYIPLATPLRWSVNSPRTPGIKANIRAHHPLHRLTLTPT